MHENKHKDKTGSNADNEDSLDLKITTSQSMENKKSTKQTEEEDLKCSNSNCHEKFFTYQDVISQMHFKCRSEPNQCLVCGKHFSNKLNLKTHVQTHFKVKQYYCDSCNLYFNRSDYFDNHLTRRNEFDFNQIYAKHYPPNPFIFSTSTQLLKTLLKNS